VLQNSGVLRTHDVNRADRLPEANAGEVPIVPVPVPILPVPVPVPMPYVINYPQTQCEPDIIEINVEQSPTSSTNSLLASVEASGYVRECRLSPRPSYLPSCCRTLVF
jgi:hypothetical protein